MKMRNYIIIFIASIIALALGLVAVSWNKTTNDDRDFSSIGSTNDKFLRRRANIFGAITMVDDYDDVVNMDDDDYVYKPDLDLTNEDPNMDDNILDDDYNFNPELDMGDDEDYVFTTDVNPDYDYDTDDDDYEFDSESQYDDVEVLNKDLSVEDGCDGDMEDITVHTEDGTKTDEDTYSYDDDYFLIEKINSILEEEVSMDEDPYDDDYDMGNDDYVFNPELDMGDDYDYVFTTDDNPDYDYDIDDEDNEFDSGSLYDDVEVLNKKLSVEGGRNGDVNPDLEDDDYFYVEDNRGPAVDDDDSYTDDDEFAPEEKEGDDDYVYLTTPKLNGTPRSNAGLQEGDDDYFYIETLIKRESTTKTGQEQEDDDDYMYFPIDESFVQMPAPRSNHRRRSAENREFQKN